MTICIGVRIEETVLMGGYFCGKTSWSVFDQSKQPYSVSPSFQEAFLRHHVAKLVVQLASNEHNFFPVYKTRHGTHTCHKLY